MKKTPKSVAGSMLSFSWYGALKFVIAIGLLCPMAAVVGTVAMGQEPTKAAAEESTKELAEESATNSSESPASYEFASVTKRWKDLRRPYAIAATKDTTQLYVSAYENGGIGVFKRDVDSGAITNQAVLGSRPGMIDLRLSEDETRAVGCSYLEGLYLFDRDEDGGLKELFHLENVADDDDSLARAMSLALSPDGRFAYVVDEERNALFVFEVTETKKLSFLQKHDGIDDCLAGARLIATDSTGEKLFVTGSKNGTLTVFDRDPVAGHVRLLGHVADGKDGVTKLAGAHGVTVSPDDRFVYVVCGRLEGDQSICVFELLDEGKLKLIQEWEPTLKHPFSGGSHIGVSPDGKHVIATAWETKNIAHFLRDPKTGEITFHEFCLFEDNVEVGKTTQPYFSPDGKFFYVGSFSGNVLTYRRKN